MPSAWRGLSACLVAALALMGCGRQASTSAMPRSTAAGPAVPTAAMTAVPTSAPTNTPAPSPIPPPTLTRTPPPSLTAPPPTKPVSTPEADAAAEPDLAATLVAGQPPRVYATYTSADGRLRAEVLIYDCVATLEGQENAYDVLNMVETAGGESHVADGQLQYCGGLGAFGLGGLFWSPGGRYFYYTKAREGVPDGCGYWTRPVSRVDTEQWAAEDLGSGPLSPDGTRLAAWDEDGRLVVWDLDGEPLGSVAPVVPELARGPIAWSPDGRSLAYVQAAAFCVPGQSGRTTVALVDPADMSGRLLISSESPAFQDVAWDESGKLLLSDDDGGRWLLDPATGQLAREGG